MNKNCVFVAFPPVTVPEIAPPPPEGVQHRWLQEKASSFDPRREACLSNPWLRTARWTRISASIPSPTSSSPGDYSWAGGPSQNLCYVGHG